jgi:DNA (cytosine-5)-methyltransferase 1
MFAGAGGLSQGFIDAGFQVAASVDADKWAALTQRENHASLENPTVVIEDSVENVTAEQLLSACRNSGASRPDVLMGGPPCQGFSRSNMRTRSMENPNNCLFREFLKLVDQLRPRIVVLENVADFAKFNKGAVADEIKESLQGMSVKYELDSAILCAADYGVPQRRNRVFFIAVEDGLHFEFPEKSGKQAVTLWDAISDLPELPNGNKEDACGYASPSQTDYQELMRQGCGDVVHNNLVSQNGQLVLDRYKHIKQGQNWESIPDNLMANYADKSRTHHWIYLRLKQDEPAVTITHFRKSMLIHPKQDRGLSVREAARVQSFRDSFLFHGPLMHQQQQVANAVPPLLAEAVARAVRQTLGI